MTRHDILERALSFLKFLFVSASMGTALTVCLCLAESTQVLSSPLEPVAAMLKMLCVTFVVFAVHSILSAADRIGERGQPRGHWN